MCTAEAERAEFSSASRWPCAPMRLADVAVASDTMLTLTLTKALTLTLTLTLTLALILTLTLPLPLTLTWMKGTKPESSPVLALLPG